MAKYRMIYDLHTHTVFQKGVGRQSSTVTHAVGTVEENVLAAKERGLSAVGISNHGPGHLTYGLPIADATAVLGEIVEARRVHPDIKILFGVEANICNASGNLDLSTANFEKFDYVMAGYHYGVLDEETGVNVLILAANWIYESFRLADLYKKIPLGKLKQSGESAYEMLLRENTARMALAVRKNKPMVLTHPGDKGPYDIDEIARACAEAGTWMEINDSHRDLSVEGIRTAAKYDVKFIIGSDAHRPQDVGTFENALERALEAGLSMGRIVNIEAVPAAGTRRESKAQVQPQDAGGLAPEADAKTESKQEPERERKMEQRAVPAEDMPEEAVAAGGTKPKAGETTVEEESFFSQRPWGRDADVFDRLKWEMEKAEDRIDRIDGVDRSDRAGSGKPDAAELPFDQGGEARDGLQTLLKPGQSESELKSEPSGEKPDLNEEKAEFIEERPEAIGEKRNRHAAVKPEENLAPELDLLSGPLSAKAGESWMGMDRGGHSPTAERHADDARSAEAVGPTEAVGGQAVPEAAGPRRYRIRHEYRRNDMRAALARRKARERGE